MPVHWIHLVLDAGPESDLFRAERYVSITVARLMTGGRGIDTSSMSMDFLNEVCQYAHAGFLWAHNSVPISPLAQLYRQT